VAYILYPIFLYSTTPLAPPNNSHIVPWYLAGPGIGLFGTLQSLKVVYTSEAEFASDCMIIDQYGREPSSSRPPSSRAFWLDTAKSNSGRREADVVMNQLSNKGWTLHENFAGGILTLAWRITTSFASCLSGTSPAKSGSERTPGGGLFGESVP
jgi:hypothetical protein